jgi:hypothetical protein
VNNSEYQHPEWQKKRLEVMEAANFKCQCCGNTEQQLNVHHIDYDRDKKIWEYDLTELLCVCDSCHQLYHTNLSCIREIMARFNVQELEHFRQIIFLITALDQSRPPLLKKLFDTCMDFEPMEAK